MFESIASLKQQPLVALEYLCWCDPFQASSSLFCYCKLVFSWFPFFIFKTIVCSPMYLKEYNGNNTPPLLTYNRCKRGWVYYRQWIVITQLTIRFSSVHVAHTCGLLALLLTGIWEILMKNKAGMTRRDSTAHTGYFTHRKKVKFKIRWFGENALWWGSMPGWLCKGNRGPAHCCLGIRCFSL